MNILVPVIQFGVIGAFLFMMTWMAFVNTDDYFRFPRD